MVNCIFCKKLQDGSEIIYKDNTFAAQFDRFPVSPGHAELFPVYHIVNIEDMNVAERIELFYSLEKLKERIDNMDLEKIYGEMVENPLNETSKTMCEEMLSKLYLKDPIVDYNFGCNNGRLAGRTVDHLHFHFIPRHESDVMDPVGGIRNIIPSMGNYRDWKKPEK